MLVNILFPELEKLVSTLHMASVYALLYEILSAKHIVSCHLIHLVSLLESTSKRHYRNGIRDVARTSIVSVMSAKSLELKHTFRLIRELDAEIEERGFHLPDY